MERSKHLGERGLGKAQRRRVGWNCDLREVQGAQKSHFRDGGKRHQSIQSTLPGLNPSSATRSLYESGAGHLTFLCLGFLICQVGIKPVSSACHKD